MILNDVENAILRSLNDGPLSAILAIILVAFLVAIILLILWGLFYAIDSSCRPVKTGTGKISKKEFIPGYTEVIWINNFPHKIRHSGKWSVNVEVDGKMDDIYINHELYNSLEEGNKVSAIYATGRLTRKMYLIEVSPL